MPQTHRLRSWLLAALLIGVAPDLAAAPMHGPARLPQGRAPAAVSRARIGAELES